MRISERIYNRLLGLYPAAFLRDYREPMQQAFRDHLRGAGHSEEGDPTVAANVGRSGAKPARRLVPRTTWYFSTCF